MKYLNISQYPWAFVPQMSPTLPMKKLRHNLGNLPEVTPLRSSCLVIVLIVTTGKWGGVTGIYKSERMLNTPQRTGTTTKDYLAKNVNEGEKPTSCYPSVLTILHSHCCLLGSKPQHPCLAQGLCWLLIPWGSAQMSLPQRGLPWLCYFFSQFHHC